MSEPPTEDRFRQPPPLGRSLRGEVLGHLRRIRRQVPMERIFAAALGMGLAGLLLGLFGAAQHRHSTDVNPPPALQPEVFNGR